MQKLKNGLKAQSKEVTIIVVVDELDRCLPEYAIKVLERLHNLPNRTCFAVTHRPAATEICDINIKIEK